MPEIVKVDHVEVLNVGEQMIRVTEKGMRRQILHGVYCSKGIC